MISCKCKHCCLISYYEYEDIPESCPSCGGNSTVSEIKMGQLEEPLLGMSIYCSGVSCSG